MRLLRIRGFVLISVLFLAVLVSMYLIASTILSRGRFGSVQENANDKIAEMAALSGIEYALARLEEDPAWRGGLNKVTVESPNLTVVEDQGNVVGLVTSPGGGVAQFRLRFNWQNGDGGADLFDDPETNMAFDSPHISVNNLLELAPASLPIGDGAGNSANSIAPYSVPPGAVAIVSEGRVGRDFRTADSSNPNPSATRLDSVRVIEAMHRVESIAGHDLTDAVGMAGKAFELTLFDGSGGDKPRLRLDDTREEGSPRIRARHGDITVTEHDTNSDGLIEGEAGELLVDVNSSVVADLSSSGVVAGQEEVNDDFYQLTWQQVGQPDGSSGSLAAGVYVVRDDGQVYHYPMNYEEYQDYRNNNPDDLGVLQNLDGSNGVRYISKGEDYEGQPSDRHRFLFTDDVLIESNGSTVDLTIMPEKGTKEDLEPTGGGGGDWSYSFPPTASTIPEKFGHLLGAFSWPNPSTGQLLMPTGLSSTPPGQLTTDQLETYEFLRTIAPSGSIGNGTDEITWSGNHFLAQGGTDLVWRDYVLNPPGGGFASSVTVDASNGYVDSSTGALDINLFYDAISSSGGAPTEAVSEFFNLDDTTTVNDMEVKFEPENQNGVRLANEENGGGDIRIAGDIQGDGASIKSDGQIRLVGMGFDVDANSSEEGPKVSLFAKDNIVISTLKPDFNGDYAYSGASFQGLLYSWGSIELKAGHANEDPSSSPQQIYMRGSMIAYGGEPGVDDPGTRDGGHITLTGDNVDLVYDPSYLLGLRSDGGVLVSLELISQAYR
jgi:hypothetical protein